MVCCSRSCSQFGLLLWKNWLLQKRKIVLTLVEILVPVLLAFVLLAIRFKVESKLVPEPITEPSFEVTNEFDYSNLKVPRGASSNKWFLAYSPNNQMTRNIVERAALAMNMSFDEKLGFDNEQDIENITSTFNKVFGGVVFLNASFNGTDLSKNITYKIRLRAEKYNGSALPAAASVGKGWQTDKLMPLTVLVGPRQQNQTQGGTDPGYFKEGFLTMQRAIDSSIIVELSGNASTMKSYLKKFPFPPYVDDVFVFILQTQFPFIIMLSFIVIAASICSEVTYEKEKKLKESMKLMGLKSWTNWCAWYFKYAVLMFVSVVLMTIVFHIKTKNGSIISYTQSTITFVFLFLYTLSTTMFCFFISTLFNKASSSAAAGAVGFIVTYFPQFFLYFYFDTMSNNIKALISLLPNLAMCLGCRVIAKFEGIGVGVQWSKLTWGPDTVDTFSMLHVMIMFVVDIIIYGILTWYIDAVKPGEFGTPQPFYFPFTKKYWCGGRSTSDLEHLFEGPPSYGARSEYFEVNPSNGQVGIKIRNLTKIFSKNIKPAVNNLNLDVYEGVITALLGHNGAGKTTTMSMLTGFISPTSGTAYINAYNIKEDMENIRQSLGLCPQFNILFDNMTVKEHLTFFAKLKGCMSEDVSPEVDNMIKLLRLEDKRNTPSKALSGGMKRKLSVGIALIGGSKFVILDEPSSGMDPEARRQMWDVLKNQQKGRTMILSTHYMDEADYLGDRIAIMADGAVHCYGSPLFLKRKYGIGYHMTMVKTADCDASKIDQVIKNKVPDAQLESSAGAELTYILPKESSPSFSTLFSELEKNGDALGVASFGASVTTLEEVFIKVGEMHEQDEVIERRTENTGKNHEEVQQTKSYDFINSNAVLEPSEESRVTGVSLLFLKFFAMLHKKFLHTWRNRTLALVQILVPVAFTIIACLIPSVIPKKLDPPPLVLDLAKYKNPVTYYAQSNTSSLSVPNARNSLNCYETASSTFQGSFIYLNNQIDSYKNESDMDSYFVESAKKNFYDYRTKYAIAGEVGSGYFLGFYNDESFHTIAMTLSLINNAWLQCLSNPHQPISDYTIRTINHPLPWSLNSKAMNDRDNSKLVGFMFSYCVMFGMAFLIATFIIFLVNERMSGAKSSQYVSGVTSATFWSSTFIWDYFNYLIPATLIVFVILAFQLEGYSYGHNAGYIFLVLMLYGWSVLPSTYILSFFFSKGSSGFVWTSIINIFTGTAATLAIFILQSPALDLLYLADRLEWVFYALFPNFCFEKSLQDLFTNYQNNQTCSMMESALRSPMDRICSFMKIQNMTNPCCPEICGSFCITSQPDYLSWPYPAIGRSLAFMAIQGFVFFALLFVFESDIINRIRSAMSSQVYMVDESGSSVHPENIRGEDSDVLVEKEAVMKLDSSELVTDDNVLILKQLSKKYSGNFLAVNNLCLKVPTGECFGLLGVNGAGKTSTFKMLTGDETISGGNVYIKGIDVARHLALTRRYVGYCPQFDALVDQMTVRENLVMHSRLRGIKQERMEVLIDELVRKLMLEKYVNKLAGKLSGGNKRKLGIAIALVGDPLLVFLDEPSAGMDPVARRELWNSVAALRDSGSTIILTSHSMEECEALCTRLAIMVNGEFKCLGGTQHLKSKFGSGYSVIIKIDQTGDNEQNVDYTNEVKKFMDGHLPGSQLEYEGDGLLSYRVEKSIPGATLANIFGLLESSKEILHLDDYSVGQATLEQVFINFARGQREIGNDPQKKSLKKKCRNLCCCCCI